MADKVWLSYAEVGTKLGLTRQWVWSQVKANPDFPRLIKLTAR